MTALLDLIDEVSNIKQDLRTAINNKGGSLSSSTPFADYVDAIGNIPSSNAILEKTLSGAQTFNVQSIGDNALSKNNSMTSISLPNCTSIGERAIQGCTSLVSASLPIYEGWTINTSTGDVDKWTNGNGGYCFEYCENLETLDLSSLEIMPGDFMAECENISSFTAPNMIGLNGSAIRVKWDSQKTPYDICTELGLDFMNYLYLSKMTDILSGYVTDSNNNITNTLSFPNLLTIEEEFINFDISDSSHPLYNIKTLSMPSLLKISDWARISANITSLDLSSIISIGNGALENCNSLLTISIGKHVKQIGSSAFVGCHNVTTVDIDINQSTQDQEIIDNVINTAPWGLDQSVTINWTGQ